MSALIRITAAEYVSGYSLRLKFSDGDERTVDFSPWLRGPVFQRLRETREFKRFFVSGGTVCWPNGADLAPETLRQAEDVSASAA
jgi:hypothetical protein